MYTLIRNILFRFDAERVHYFSMNSLQNLCKIPGLRSMLTMSFKPKPSPVSIFGLQFRNPIGLAAGFDKNANYLDLLDMMGFGHVEIGTITPLPQLGNDKPRLFRLTSDKAIINRMGFNNDGMDTIATRLKQWRKKYPKSKMIIGGNIGKNKVTPNEEAWKDYVKCFQTLHPFVDYFVVNVSSPNTPGLRELQEKPALEKICKALKAENEKLEKPLPLLLKIAPDLTNEQLKDICSLTNELQLKGLVATNTTISRDNLSSTSIEQAKEIGMGGLSGYPLKKRSTEVLDYLNQYTNGNITLIGSGGVFTADDAKEKIHHGAKLIQVWTGFIYEGPFIVKKICKYL